MEWDVCVAQRRSAWRWRLTTALPAHACSGHRRLWSPHPRALATDAARGRWSVWRWRSTAASPARARSGRRRRWSPHLCAFATDTAGLLATRAAFRALGRSAQKRSRGSQRVAGLGEPGAAGGRAGRRAREASGRRGQPKDRAAWLSSRKEAKGEGRRAERQPPTGEHDGELARQRDGGLISLSLRGFLQNYWETNNLNHPYSRSDGRETHATWPRSQTREWIALGRPFVF